MKASLLVERWRGSNPQQVDEAAKQAALDGNFMRWAMMPIETTSNGFVGRFYVAASYFSVGDEQDSMFMPLSPLAAQDIADHYGWRLPTKKMVDLIWKGASLKVSPMPWGPPYDSSMVSLDRFIAQSKRVTEQLYKLNTGWKVGLIAGTHKDVVLTNKLVPGRVAIYGWHNTRGQVIQTLNPTTHEDTYADYSHGIRFVLDAMLVNGIEMGVNDVLVSPEMCGLLSDEGPMRVLRQPRKGVVPPPLPKPKEDDVLKKGSLGPLVRRWQEFLTERGFRDPQGAELVPDGNFGEKTEFATKQFQVARGLVQSGSVDADTLKVAAMLGFGDEAVTDPAVPKPIIKMKFIKARNFTVAFRTAMDLVVIHTMEAPQKPTTAEAVANWFAGAQAPQASSHYCIDSASTIQCVLEKDVAWHAPGANSNGIGIEHAGYAKQTPSEWASPENEAMFKLSAALVADICKRWSIPVERLTVADLKAKKRGICGHVDVTNAFNDSKGHTDPGPGFPWQHFMDLVAAAK